MLTVGTTGSYLESRRLVKSREDGSVEVMVAPNSCTLLENSTPLDSPATLLDLRGDSMDAINGYAVDLVLDLDTCSCEQDAEAATRR